MTDETVLKAEVGKSERKAALPALLLVAAGVFLLLANLLDLHLSDYLWPVFIIGPGLLMMWPSFKSTRDNQSSLSFFAVPGAMTVAFGALMFLMNLTDHFESMAYAWTLVLAAGAAGYVYMNRFDEDKQASEKAHGFIRTMLLAFMILAAFFELVVFNSLGDWWPLLLIGLGTYLWIKDKRSVNNE